MKYPKERRSHSSVLLNSPSGSKLLVIGGTDYIGFTCEDCWTFDIKKIIWNEVKISLDSTHIPPYMGTVTAAIVVTCNCSLLKYFRKCDPVISKMTAASLSDISPKFTFAIVWSDFRS